MSARNVLIVIVLLLAIASPALRPRAHVGVAAVAGGGFAYAKAPADPATGTFKFDPSVSAVNRQAFLNVLTHVRPEAAKLFDRVDGLVTVVDAEAGHGYLGVTIPERDGYVIRFAFGPVFQQLGQRGFDRLVEHELGHVVDHALIPHDLQLRLDAGIPPGEPCQAGTRTGSCAPREERFAESFAKWASGDLGVNIYAGYAVPPPGDLEAWGAPLAAIANGG